jgi:hypothetical protein
MTPTTCIQYYVLCRKVESDSVLSERICGTFRSSGWRRGVPWEKGTGLGHCRDHFVDTSMSCFLFGSQSLLRYLPSRPICLATHLLIAECDAISTSSPLHHLPIPFAVLARDVFRIETELTTAFAWHTVIFAKLMTHAFGFDLPPPHIESLHDRRSR